MNQQPEDKIEEQIIKETWANLWASKEKDKVEKWDSLSEIVFSTLLHECKKLKYSPLKIVEAGCGTGRICRELLSEKMNVYCLDIAQEALDLAKDQIGDDAHYILGSILDMPKGDLIPPFNVVWNSGVMEHFSPEDQKKALREFALSLSLEEPSAVITLTPYKNSFLYRFGKLVLEKLNKWPFGREIPVATLSDVMPKELVLKREYSVAFLPLLLDSYKWIPPLKPIGRGVYFLLKLILRRSGLRILDRIFSKIFGGYLLVSVFTLSKEQNRLQ